MVRSFRCRRCGTVFKYEDREGVCPKCCFYNRRTPVHDEENLWLNDYHIDKYEAGYYDRHIPEIDEKESQDQLKDYLKNFVDDQREILKKKQTTQEKKERRILPRHKSDSKKSDGNFHIEDGQVIPDKPEKEDKLSDFIMNILGIQKGKPIWMTVLILMVWIWIFFIIIGMFL